MKITIHNIDNSTTIYDEKDGYLKERIEYLKEYSEKIGLRVEVENE
jgi:hypothetical protein